MIIVHNFQCSSYNIQIQSFLKNLGVAIHDKNFEDANCHLKNIQVVLDAASKYFTGNPDQNDILSVQLTVKQLEQRVKALKKRTIVRSQSCPALLEHAYVNDTPRQSTLPLVKVHRFQMQRPFFTVSVVNPTLKNIAKSFLQPRVLAKKVTMATLSFLWRSFREGIELMARSPKKTG